MAGSFATFVAVTDASSTTALVRGGLRRLRLPLGASSRPSAGDRIVVLATQGPSFVATAAFIGSAEVLSDDGETLNLRHRVVAPAHHPVLLGALPMLRVAAGWTHERLGALRDGAVRCSAHEFERVEEALLQVALRFGPPAKRPAHRRPRTPGRRALIAGRSAAGRRR